MSSMLGCASAPTYEVDCEKRLAQQHLFGAECVAILAHSLNLAVAYLEEKVIQIVVNFSVGEFSVGLGFNRNSVIFGGQTLRCYLSALRPSLRDRLLESGKLCFGLCPGEGQAFRPRHDRHSGVVVQQG